MVYAHRLAWELTYGPIPDGMLVCHHCDNPICCRPDHLFLGTPSDNMQDALRKGRFFMGERRSVLVRGERSGMAKLRTPDVLAIRERYAQGDISQLALAKEYGVAHQLVSRIIRREIWAHV